MNHSTRRVALLFCCTLSLAILSTIAPAQTLTPLHGFSGYTDGRYPVGGLSRDEAGNLYGVAYAGGFMQCFNRLGSTGCGVVFKLMRHGANFVFQVLYEFGGQPDGGIPYGRVIVGPDGELYGATSQGGNGACTEEHGCGTVFKLQPPPNICPGTGCRWRETILYNFASHSDGYQPVSELYFDHAGNLYGTTQLGGGGVNCPNGNGCGTVFELTPNSNGTWTKSTLYAFQGVGSDGTFPMTGVVLDQAGNIYGTTNQGGSGSCTRGCGTVFQLSPNGSGWSETLLHNFANGSDGENPGQLTFDASGNLWGPSQNVTLFELTPQAGGGWQFSVQFTFDAQNTACCPNAVTFDASGNVYGTLNGDDEAPGRLYSLTPSGSGWNYNNLYSFNYAFNDQGFNPVGNVVLDSEGNIYGMNTNNEIPPPYGTAWEFTP
jgi:uncharacterized repeat protein (TIGR03803 family)